MVISQRWITETLVFGGRYMLIPPFVCWFNPKCCSLHLRFTPEILPGEGLHKREAKEGGESKIRCHWNLHGEKLSAENCCLNMMQKIMLSQSKP
jgi:hypothetical protein